MPKTISVDHRPNPFEFGSEVNLERLVDREEELRILTRAAVNRERLFLIGPRRYGKTSILAATGAALEHSTKIAVLRYDAETYETLGRLVEALLAGAARKLTGNLQQAGDAVKRMFARLRPSIDYDFAGQTLTVSLGLATQGAERTLPLLTDVLDAIDTLAGKARRTALVIIDEFQHVIREGGEAAERQIRSVVQRHKNLAYIFSGSKTRMLVDMTNSPQRAFWKLGSRFVLGPVPRLPFLEFLRRGFKEAGMRVQEGGLEHLMDVAEDVPYNVQQLAHMAWELLRIHPKSSLTEAFVDDALRAVVAREHSPYTQLWTSLTQTQRIVVRAVIDQQGHALHAKDTLARYNVAASTMTRALKALDERGVIREEENGGGIRYRLEDPFLAAWLLWAQRG
jgi:hypothetical protein